MCAAFQGRRRPRPVADVPAVDGRVLARAWLLELVAATPMERAAALPGPGFAIHAPRLCAALVAALATEAAFDDLEPGGARAPLAADAATIAGAESAAEAIAFLEALRAVTWAELLDTLHHPPPSLLGDVADRLAAAVATVTAASLDATSLPTRPGDRGPLAALLRADPASADDPAPPEAPPSAPPRPDRFPREAPEAGAEAP
ncbi:MAG TPA: hypothetical protein VGW10_16385, partial [Solirubrobacteraceae bacterium]|nr:hypothetical protein [Solirubrobacteraceae bacterium]